MPSKTMNIGFARADAEQCPLQACLFDWYWWYYGVSDLPLLGMVL